MKMVDRSIQMALALSGILIFTSYAHGDLHIATPNVDLGEVRAGRILKHTFSFRNAGSDVIEILEARASCGCLTPQLSKQSVPPGESGELTLEINTLSQPAGRNVWNVTLTHRHGEKTESTTLRLTANLIREIDVEPTAVTLLAGTSITHELTITDRRIRPLSVVDVQCSSDKLTAKIEKAAKNSAGERVSKVRVRLGGDCPDGRHEEAVAVYTDDAEYPMFKVPITIVKQSRQHLAASPSRVTLVAFIGQAIPSRVILIRSPEGQPVIVDRITADHHAVVSSWAPGPGAMATVKISVDRARMSGNALKSMIHVHVSKPLQETLSIPINCELQ